MTVAGAIDTLVIDSPKTGRFARGLRVVGQRLYHRLTTPPGSLYDSKAARSFGYDVPAQLGAVGDDRSLRAAVEVRARVELEKDPAVQTASVAIESSRSAAGEIKWRITADARTTAGPIRLVLGVDGVTSELLELLEPTEAA
jgi:hypothetical protein